MGMIKEEISQLKISEIVKEEAKAVVVTLSNADLDRMYTVLWEKDSDGILAGASALARILHAEKPGGTAS